VKHVRTGPKRGQFSLLAATRSAQFAKITLAPGSASDSEASNEHPRSEQWVFVVSGSGEAFVGKRRGQLRRTRLRQNSLLVIEKGELHQIKNTGRRPLVTLNWYVPPAYEADGEPK
jgi:oxalate decarboxylase/phosphoglucose isomerase-like protein (cupin superfamily)